VGAPIGKGTWRVESGLERQSVFREKRVELCGVLESTNRIQFLESGSESIRDTPEITDGELLVLRSEVVLVNCRQKLLRQSELFAGKGVVQHRLRVLVGQLAFLPFRDLFLYGVEVPLDAVDPERYGVGYLDVLRVLGHHGSKFPDESHVVESRVSRDHSKPH
jgi:hypothetical protein